MSKKLVAYFSATGHTKAVADKLAEILEADTFEIVPAVPYTEADLDWMNCNSRSSVEMNDRRTRPAIVGKVENMDEYDTVFLGFPVWWYTEPRVVDTFLDQYDFSAKTLVLFGTSGSSDLSKAVKSVREKVKKGTKLVAGKVLNGKQSYASLSAFVEGLGL